MISEVPCSSLQLNGSLQSLNLTVIKSIVTSSRQAKVPQYREFACLAGSFPDWLGREFPFVNSTTLSRSQVPGFCRLLPPPCWPPSFALLCYLFVLGEWFPLSFEYLLLHATAELVLACVELDTSLAAVLASFLLFTPSACCDLGRRPGACY